VGSDFYIRLTKDSNFSEEREEQKVRGRNPWVARQGEKSWEGGGGGGKVQLYKGRKRGLTSVSKKGNLDRLQVKTRRARSVKQVAKDREEE